MKRCEYYIISRHQRTTERARGLNNDGTKGYEEMGCYNCDGKNSLCESYMYMEEIDGEDE